MSRLQDMCLAAEERAHGAERRASVADARCQRAEAGLRDAAAEIKEHKKGAAAVQVQGACMLGVHACGAMHCAGAKK